MSLDTLAAAASFVESEDSKNKQNTRANASKSPVTSATSDSDSEKGKRRPGGAGTREIHNRLEKNRRAHLKICYETLRKEIPTLEDKRTSNLNILKSALRYIQNLEKKTKEALREKEYLRKHNLSLRERLQVLRNEIKILLETGTKNGVKTEGPASGIELPAPMDTEGDSNPANIEAAVSVATQTMPLVKKPKIEIAQASEDEEINVDEVTES
ncbi:max dimerization protein 3-like [Dendronephthya gigantea]|uniref:max dimerization protein 3-like n=1 Tax=Dendronephthya gigantea TaxID=151771 RepID=UPI00106DB135|nr:max dimerization protein 3-like [Dendronephthya gigantea]